MVPQNRIGNGMTLAALLATALIASSAQAALVAYFPADSATDSSTFLDDIIDDASHGAADGIGNNNTGGIVVDGTRGDVAYSPQGHRYTAGTQDIDLSEGFTWSLWWKAETAGFDTGDGGADVIIGSRSGSWNKVQISSTARFFDLGNYNVDDGEWHHIAYTGVGTGLSGSTFGEMWIDGVSVDTDTNGTYNNLTVENTKLEIGGASQFSEDTQGFVDDVAIWNEVLSDERIQGLAAGDPVQGGPVIPAPAALPAGLALMGVMLIARRRSTKLTTGRSA